MLTINEIHLSPFEARQVRPLPDGWRPLAVWADGAEIVVAYTADDERDLDRETFRLLSPGADLEELVGASGNELAYLGTALGHYVYLDVPAEEPERRSGRPDTLGSI